MMKSNKLRLGFVQSRLSNQSLERRYKTLMRHIRSLIIDGAKLILLPEIFLGSPSSKKSRSEYAAIYLAMEQGLQSLAKIHDVAFYGAFYKKSTHDTYYNRAQLILPAKPFCQSYDKKHLFHFAGEHKIYTAGTQDKLFQSPWGKLAPLICYDIRFPEQLRKLVFKGAKIALVTAQWPSSRVEHWLTLLKARAIENQVFVFACNIRGHKDSLIFNGHSCVISPWGEMLFLLKNQATGIVDVDLSLIDKIRREYPFLKDAKL
jgi:omega-amidase